MKSYPSYKDSGVEWMGRIPCGWTLIQLGLLCESISNGTTKTQVLEDTDYSVTRIETISTGNIDISKVGYIDYYHGIENFKINDGDILFSHINSLDVVGNCAIYSHKEHGELYHGMNLLRIQRNKEKIYPSFLKSILESWIIRNTVMSLSKHAIGQVSVSINSLKSIRLAIPSLEEQIEIANYLDEKTTQIDFLIEKIERKIELIEEQRTALINKAVTKGLDPNVEMKDSGIEWIREIPKHWELTRLRFLNKRCFGGSWGEDPLDGQDTNLVKVIRVTEFDTSRLQIKRYIPTVRSLEIESTSEKLVEYGDLILEKSGGGEKTPVGRLVMVNHKIDSPTVNSNFTNLIKLDRTKCDSRYVSYLYHKIHEFGLTKRNIKQTTGIQNLDIMGLLSEKAQLPPIEEQIEIAKYLDNYSGIFLTSIELETKRIELLKEYRQSLISNVVTGKVRVVEEVA